MARRIRKRSDPWVEIKPVYLKQFNSSLTEIKQNTTTTSSSSSSSCSNKKEVILCASWLAEPGTLKNLLLRANATQQQVKHQQVISNDLTLNPKHRTVPATKKETNSIPVEIRIITKIIISPAPHGSSIGVFTDVWLALLSIQSLLIVVMIQV